MSHLGAMPGCSALVASSRRVRPTNDSSIIVIELTSWARPGSSVETSPTPVLVRMTLGRLGLAGGGGVAVITSVLTTGVPATTVTSVWTGGWQDTSSMLAITTSPMNGQKCVRDISLLLGCWVRLPPASCLTVNYYCCMVM